MDQLNHDITGIIVLDKFLEQVSGSMIEFKLDVSNDNLPQAFASMVRVGNDLLLDTLKRGKLDSISNPYFELCMTVFMATIHPYSLHWLHCLPLWYKLTHFSYQKI